MVTVAVVVMVVAATMSAVVVGEGSSTTGASVVSIGAPASAADVTLTEVLSVLCCDEQAPTRSRNAAITTSPDGLRRGVEAGTSMDQFRTRLRRVCRLTP